MKADNDGHGGDDIDVDGNLHCPVGQLGCMVQWVVVHLECCKLSAVAP